jgi:cytochrome c553
MRAAIAFACLSALAAGVRAQGAASADGFGAAEPALANCRDCHDGAGHKGRFDLAAVPANGFGADRLFAVARMRERVRTGEMPPPDAEPLTAAARDALLRWCDDTLADGVARLPWPAGRVTVRRLSRGQWQASAQALLGVETPLAARFPADDLGYGFDSIGDALSFSTLHLEAYVAAAEDVGRRAVAAFGPVDAKGRRFEAEAMELADGPGVGQDGEVANFYTRATLRQVVELPRDGRYRLVLRAAADPAGDAPARMALQRDGALLDEFEVPDRTVREFPLTTPLPGGRRTFAIAFVNDFYDPKNPDPQRRDRNLRVDWLEVHGPLDAPTPPPGAAWLPAALAKADGPAFARELLLRAWRRPPTGPEVARLRGMPPDLAIAAALASPHFLFRAEPRGGGGGGGGSISADEALADHALATRLSYFLWGSGPDDALLQDAAKGRLRDAAALRAATDRLFADARADWLATDFAAQWLELRALPERTPDPQRFPGFDDALRASLRRQTELLFTDVLREERDVRDLLACDFVHVDQRLAEHLGLPPVAGEGFERRPLAADQRAHGGVLAHASVLALTSNPTRTSPVKRGKWILENLLGAPPPPPPPGSDTLAGEKAIDSAATLRAQLAQHRADAKCAGCHVRMDGLGFALEGFDPVGRPRTTDAGGAIDARGELPGGRIVDGLPGLAAEVAADPAFVRALLRKLFVYAVGRDADAVDRLHLDARADALRRAGKVTLRALVHEVVASPPFRRRSSAR